MSISITEKAAKQATEIAESEGAAKILRMRVIGGGCAGFNYDLYLEEKPTEMDEVFECYGVTICVDPLSYQYLDGTELDYVDNGLMGSGFKFKNPNVTSSCGCGSSFSV